MHTRAVFFPVSGGLNLEYIVAAAARRAATIAVVKGTQSHLHASNRGGDGDEVPAVVRQVFYSPDDRGSTLATRTRTEQ